MRSAQKPSQNCLKDQGVDTCTPAPIPLWCKLVCGRYELSYTVGQGGGIEGVCEMPKTLKKL